MNRCVACRSKFNKITQDLYHDGDPERIMKCSRITLFDRKEKLSKNAKHSCHYQREYNAQFQNYVPWLDKTHNTCQDDRPYLTVCNLVLPTNVPVLVDSGALSERWVKKRPRLQSARIKNSRSPRSKSPDSSEDERIFHDDNTETDSQLMEIQQVMEEYEIDEHVQLLIQQAAEYDQRMAEKKLEESHNDIEEPEQRKCKKTSKNRTKDRNNETKEKPRSKLTRTLSLSRPPSPETIQVIRVDVTSNYSMEEVESEHEHQDEDMESEDEEENEEQNEIELEKNQLLSNRLSGIKSLIKQASASELTLQCQKLALSERKVLSAASSDMK